MASAIQIPKTTRALVVRKAAQATKPVFHDAVVEERPIPQGAFYRLTLAGTLLIVLGSYNSWY